MLSYAGRPISGLHGKVMNDQLFKSLLRTKNATHSVALAIYQSGKDNEDQRAYLNNTRQITRNHV